MCHGRTWLGHDTRVSACRTRGLIVSRPVQLGPRPCHRPHAAFERHHRAAYLGDRLLRCRRVEHHDVGGVADGDAVVLQTHQPSGPVRQHGRSIRASARFADLADIGLHIGDADQVAVTHRRERVENVIGGDRAVDAVLHQHVGIGDPAADAVVLVAAHHVKVGGGQHGNRHAGIGDLGGQGRADPRGGRVEYLQPCPTATRPPRPYCFVSSQTRWISMSAGLLPESRCMSISASYSRARSNIRRIWPLLVRIVIRRRADDPRAPLQRLHQQFVGALVVGQAFLREHAQFDVDRPGVVAAQFLQRIEAAHLHAGVQFDMGPHPRRAVLDAVFQGGAGALVNVFLGKGVLDGGDARDGVGVAAVLGRAAVDDAGLVQVDVGFHQSGAGQMACRIVFRRVGGETSRDRDDLAARDADIDRRAAGQARVADDQVHAVPFAPDNRAV